MASRYKQRILATMFAAVVGGLIGIAVQRRYVQKKQEQRLEWLKEAVALVEEEERQKQQGLIHHQGVDNSITSVEQFSSKM